MSTELSPETIAFLKSKGIDPSTASYVEDEPMSVGKSITSTLKAHAGGLLGGGAATLAGVALAPETGGLSLAIPVVAGLAGSYAGQKVQQAVLPDEMEQRLQDEARQAYEAHPNVSLGTDIVAGALASGGRPSLSGLLKGGKAAVTGDILNPAVKRIALGAAINPAIDVGISEASGEGMPSGRQLLADTAGGALFNESSALGRLAHRGPVSRPLPEPEVTPKNLNVPEVIEPLKMAEEQPIVSEKSKDDVTQNTMEQTTVTPSAIERKAATTEQVLGNEQPTEEKVNPSGLTSSEEDEIKKMGVYSQKKQQSSDFLSKAPEVVDEFKGDKIDGYQLVNRLRNVLSPTEFQSLEEQGLVQKFSGKYSTPQEAKQWLSENGPKVEVRKFGQGSMSTPEQRRFAELEHYFDSLPASQRGVANHYLTHLDEESYNNLGRLNPEAQRFASEYNSLNKADLHKGVEQSHWQSIAPKSEQDMPGYTEIAVVKPHEYQGGYSIIDKQGKQFGQYKDHETASNEAERLLQEYPERGPFKTAYGNTETIFPKFPSSHSFPPNTLGFVRGYMETTPQGKKVFHVIEVQSDWAQQVREEKELAKSQKLEEPSWSLSHDPLLLHYERLALKAAIDHAREQGADAIAISDAETAMMTEGHDRAAQRVIRDPSGKIVDINDERLSEHYSELPKGWTEENVPTQQEGMRLHYDRTLPKIAKELTGEKGTKESFGEHRMAVEKSQGYAGEVDTANSGPNRYRKDLIFRNESGEPKTDITARVYPLKNIPNREPYVLGKRYAQGSKSYKYNPEDYKLYNELKNKLKEHLDKGDFESFVKTQKEFEAVRNKYGGMPPLKEEIQSDTQQSQRGGESKIIAPPSVVNHIMTGTATTKSVLEGFAQSPGHTYQEIAKHLLKIGDQEGLNVKWKPSVEDRGAYENEFGIKTGKTVREAITIPHSEAGDSRVLIEEALHGLTHPKLPVELRLLTGKDLHNAMTKYLQNGSNDAVKDLIRGYQKTAEALGISEHLFGNKEGYHGLSGNPDAVEETLSRSMSDTHRPTFYAMGSLDEFIAHAFRNEQFQNILNEIPYDGQRSVWQHIVDAVKRILGFDVKTGHMLDHVLRTSSDLISQERPGSDIVNRGQSTETVEGRSQARKGKTVDDEYHMGPVGQFTRNVIDRVKDINHPGAKELANAAKLSLNEQDSLVGRWKNAVIEAGKKLTPADKVQINKVKDAELSSKTLQRGLLTTDAQREYYDAAKKAYSDNADYRISNKEPVLEGGHPRLLKKDPSYWAGMANQKVEQVYRENSNPVEIAKLDKVFDQWNQTQLGMTPKGSALRISDWKKAVQGSLRSSDVSHQDYFNASRKAMGSPLPPEFREVDPVKNDARYFDRQAIDNSHYKFIESNPKAMAALGQTKDAWGKDIVQYPEGAITAHPQVRALLDQFRGDPHGPMADTERSLSSTLSSMFISGPALETHKLISNQVKAVTFADNPYQLARALGHAVTNIKEGYIHAKENGVLKLSANSSLDMFNGSLTSAQRLNGLGKAVRDISTLGGVTTKLNAGLLQSYFEYLVPSKLTRANAGDVTNQQFIRRLDPTYTVGKVYSPIEQQKLASIASTYVHGTGDIRSMPAWMMADNETSGFFKLAHWSVAQTNNFMHDVWTPAVNGDYGPLVTSVFGSVVGGYLIKSLREELQGKKGGIPSLQEIASSSRGVEGNKGLLAYNAIAAMQYSGFGGLLSQVLKYPFDFVYKNAPQGATFPLDQIATDLAKTLNNVSSAIANDPNLNWVDLAHAVTTHILSTDIQLSRIALNQGINSGLVTGLPAEKKLLSDKLSQLRRFDMTEGLPYSDIDQGTNPLMNVEQQKFKKTSDITEAAQMIPTLINNIITKYSDHPDVMMAKIKALKENQYSTFPSMESTPMSFFKYINFLNKSVGPEKAQEALMDFMTHKITNQMKSAMVP